MKINFLLVAFLILFNKFNFSQDTLKLYYNSKWEQVNDINKAKYYRIAVNNKTNWIVKDYFADSTLQMEGFYKTNKFINKNGSFIYYYKNGNIYTKTEFKNNIQDGKYIVNYENGNLFSEGFFKNGVRTGLWKEYYKNGNLHSEGVYADSLKNGLWKNYYKNGNIRSKENYNSGKLNGLCNWYFKNGQIASEEIYEKGELKKINYWNEKGKKMKGKFQVTEFPEFPGGTKALKKFIAKNTVYPEEIRKKGIEGQVMVKYMIDTDGNVAKTEIVKSVIPLLDKEAERVVKSLPKYKPAKQHNLPVNIWYQIPITFKLK